MFRNRLVLLLIFFFIALPVIAQREYVPADHPVYRFLLRQTLEGRIQGFSWGMLPLSRHDVADFLRPMRSDSIRAQLQPVDREILDDFVVEFEHDLDGASDHAHPFIPEFQVGEVLRDDTRRYLYAYQDSGTAVFVDGLGNLTHDFSRGDSLRRAGATLGELGIRIRGTLHDRLGFCLQATNGALLGGSHDLALLDHRLLANQKFNAPGEATFYDISTGYLRYDADWLSVTLGREQMLWGVGYSDRAVFSDNSVPFSYFRIDLRSNTVHYSFLHGSLMAFDSTGHSLSSKYIAAHRVEFNVGRRVRIGFSEAILYFNQPLNFAILNPFTFLTSARLQSESATAGENNYNNLIWLDVEVLPVKDVRAYGSLLVDDLSFASLGKNNIAGNTNKFGWQGGAEWVAPFGVPALLLTAEYTRINPFVLTHWTNVNGFTHYSLSLGPSLPPNSDEWLVGADWDALRRLTVGARLRFQRSGESIRDARGNIIFDAGDDVNRGVNHLLHPNVFLEGTRVNRTIASLRVDWQPVLQYVVRFEGWVRSINYPTLDRTLKDGFASLSLRVEY